MATFLGDAAGVKNKYLQALLAEGMNTTPIQSHWQGASRMAHALLAGREMQNQDSQGKEATQFLSQALSPSAAPAMPQPTPAPAPSMPGTPMADGNLPRGYRNNNPLNIEAGTFTQGQPGFSGSDGRFAKFASMDQGVGAANKLLDVYQNKHGLNTVSGILGRWAPAGDGNNVSAYAANVSKQLGIDPNVPVPPEMRQKLIEAMAQHENGRPMPNIQPQVAQGPDANANLRTQIQQGLNSPNPMVRQQAGILANQIINKQLEGEKPTDEMREYQLYRQQGGNKSFFDFKADLKKAGATKVETNVGGGSDKQIFDAMDNSATAARQTAVGLTGLREARSALQGGAITGAGANQILGLQKIGAALGLSNSDKIVNTETFRAAIAPQVAALLKSTVGTANISNTDREFAEKAAGGNITLDGRSIERLLDIMERASTAQLKGHMDRLEKVYPDAAKYARERALFGVDMPPAVAAPTAQPTTRKFNPATGKIE